MKAKRLDEDGAKTYAVVFETGDEVMDGLTSHFTALGGAILGFFDVERKRYLEISIAAQVEVPSLVGDIALKEGE